MDDRKKLVGRYLSYPDLTGKRVAEGGRRLGGMTRKSRPEAPLVTIITVCWNSAKTIEQTIQSVLRQTYDNVEYVIVDGNSSDATLDILRKYEDRIDYYVSEPDDGLYYAMNKGLELAQGDYVLILNSDDWFASDGIAALVAAQNYSGCDFVAALARYMDEDKGEAEILRPMPFDDSVYFRMPLRHETMLIPARLYDKLGPYNTDYRIIADRDYTARLFDAGATFYELPRALLDFRTTGVSSTNLKLLAREKDALLAQEFPFLTALERQTLNDPVKATPEDFARIANTHLDQPKFVKACRAVLDDRRAKGGKRWQSDALVTIGASDPVAWPKVSVILPFYEAETSIAASLDSVLAQSLTEFEIICVNDCAIDGSQSVVDAYAARDPRVKCLRNDRNIGLGASRNAGIRAACGRYIFHLDPDDTLPQDALERLYDTAVQHGSDMVKGAYRAGQGLHDQQAENVTVKYPCGVRKQTIVNTRLGPTPRLLHTTEGHWSYLYEANFARRVPYPTDLKMGQDSIFLVNAVARARKVTLLPVVVYNYEANPNSAMNHFTARKYFDGLEWRRRAWYVLRDAGYIRSGERLLFAFWSEAFFDGLDATMTGDEKLTFYSRLARFLREAGYPGTAPLTNPVLRARFADSLARFPAPPADMAPQDVVWDRDRPLRIATFSTQDHGGAGLGSQRRVEALRNTRVDAEIHCVFQKTDKAHVHRVPLLGPLPKDPAPEELHAAWRQAAVLTRKEHPGLKAREMFSKPGTVADYAALAPVFDKADIVHMHWVSGLFDFERTDLLSDTPVAWTLADMNAFTGGCHYSEGCTRYRNDCRNCPLLEPGSTLAHETWNIKRKAYAKIPNLHVICPSQWLADCAQESSLFGDRPIHVIPNAFPVDRFTPTNKQLARRRLGLPLDKKLVVFGADSLNNRRKGGDILRASLQHLKSMGKADGVEGLFFGSSSLDLGVRAHNMGHVTDERKMSLIYAAADVFAFPSREDNAPLTVAESLLSGTPVVAFPVGNVPQMIQHRDTGFIARYEDAKEFAEGLAWALADPRSIETLERGLRGHIQARAHNDPKTAVNRHLALYREMTNDPAGGLTP
ncbi:glycosyltransferase [Puniceibacterium sp. IMCC21224]|uniref:glycosyltransferase n=1 Tax=Puniceibacterium sp. IMCC21224 TaxID=1618204 RepID=UPI00069E4516|nr:glycosyltransferase [Puniceibacterium sp. IMCC21224]